MRVFTVKTLTKVRSCCNKKDEILLEDIQKSIKVGDEAEKAQEITKSVISMASSNELYNSTFINLH